MGFKFSAKTKVFDSEVTLQVFQSTSLFKSLHLGKTGTMDNTVEW